MRAIVLVLMVLSGCGGQPPARGAGLDVCDHLVAIDGHLRMVRCCSDAGC